MNTKSPAVLSLLTSALLFFISQPLFAEHFHYFVDVETHFAVNENKQLTALEVSWIYDEKMSGLMKKQNPNLTALGKATLNDLDKSHYFLNLRHNGKPVKLGRVNDFRLQEISDQEGRKALQLDFIVPLQNPLNMNGKNTLTWDFADPSGIAVLMYYDKSNIRLGSRLATHCTTRMHDNEAAEHGDPAQKLALECKL